MPRKIYDIKHPKLVRKESESRHAKERVNHEDVPEVFVEPKSKKQHNRNKKEGRSVWLPVSVGILVILLSVGTYLFFKLPKADIVIWPNVETLSFKQIITTDKSVDSVDLTKTIIPAQYFQATKTNSQDFPATGNATNEGQASGTITIYNKFSPPAPLTLKVGTKFLSNSGKLFASLQKIVIPAAKKSGSKITPGSISVKVQAIEGGTSYNIAPSDFSVPGLKGTAYYYSIYANSTTAMAGGYDGKVKKVTDDDISSAKDVLTKQTTSDAISNLKDQIPEGYILLDDAILSNTVSASTQTKSGTVVESFNYQVAVKASALAFKKSDLDEFVKNYIVSQIPDGKTLLDNSLKVDYSASKVDVSGGKATLSLDFSSGVYQNINKNSITLSSLGKSESQIKETINNSLGDQVSKTIVKFWPFWVSSAPKSQKAVNVELKF